MLADLCHKKRMNANWKYFQPMSLILQAYHQKSEAQETYVLGEPSPSYVHKDLFLINFTEIK